MTESSFLTLPGQQWYTSKDYGKVCPDLTGGKFMQVTDLLLENPNLNSTHLFRADILYDSTGTLKTVDEKAQDHSLSSNDSLDNPVEAKVPVEIPDEIPVLQDANLRRQVLRRLIPRKPQLDAPLDQWCYIYDLAPSIEQDSGHLVIYVPQIESEKDMPWYHPPIKSMAYVFRVKAEQTSLSIHFRPFATAPSVEIPSRMHRTFIALVQTFIRLAKNPAPADTVNSNGPNHVMTPAALKDTILPQHIVQDTYSRLKQVYAADLISRWAESTDPAKHVFEDISIAAFIIELWKQMYAPGDFPGFIDLACGNGVLSYILIKEGYRGRGFDARRRKTWEVLEMDSYLDEMICVPDPFITSLQSHQVPSTMESFLSETRIHNGIFPPGTFIISNHADELTPWTPLFAALSSPSSPLPFLAIPCCSHALSGAKHRYSPKSAASSQPSALNDTEEQSKSGDLKSLREAKMRERSGTDDKSMYACLTRKVVSLAEEVGFEVELTLMRIPSTRNIGVVGNRKVVARRREENQDTPADLKDSALENHMIDQVQRVVERECGMSGGIKPAAETWISRAQKLHAGAGRGKVNLGRKIITQEHENEDD